MLRTSCSFAVVMFLSTAAVADEPSGRGFSVHIVRLDIDSDAATELAELNEGRTQTLSDEVVRDLLDKAAMLRASGHAQMTAAPETITSSGEAITFRQTKRFFVRVEGEDSTDLYNVELGTTTECTPRLVREDGASYIRLEVKISDSFRTDETVDGIPVVAESTVQAAVQIRPGKSVLVGGFQREHGVGGKKRQVRRYVLISPSLTQPTMPPVTAPAE